MSEPPLHVYYITAAHYTDGELTILNSMICSHTNSQHPTLHTHCLTATHHLQCSCMSTIHCSCLHGNQANLLVCPSLKKGEEQKESLSFTTAIFLHWTRLKRYLPLCLLDFTHCKHANALIKCALSACTPDRKWRNLSIQMHFLLHSWAFSFLRIMYLHQSRRILAWNIKRLSLGNKLLCNRLTRMWQPQKRALLGKVPNFLTNLYIARLTGKQHQQNHAQHTQYQPCTSLPTNESLKQH